MIQCSFNDPHHPFTPPGKYWDMYDPKDMKLPSGFDLGNAKPTPQEAWLHAQRDNGTRFAKAQAAFAVTAAETKEALWKERSIRQILAMQERADLLLFSTGALVGDPASHIYTAGYLSKREADELRAAGLDRAIADEEAHGVVKVLTVPGKDRILGVTIVGAHAGDLIAEFVAAMRHGLGLNKILGTIHIYPTLAEANKYAAGVWKKAHAPQGLLRAVERFHGWMRGG